MARRAHLRLLVTLVLSLAALFLLRGADDARANSIARKATPASISQNAAHTKNAVRCIGHGLDSRILANGPLDGDNLAAILGPWSDNDDPDDFLQASGVSVAPPSLTSGFGRRVGNAVARDSLVSAAFPRGPPAL